MKVCMIAGMARHAGGVESVVNELCRYLVSRDAEVTFFGRSDRDFVENAPNFKMVGIRPYEVVPRVMQLAYYDKLAYSLKVWRRTLRFGPYDIIHGHADNCLFSSLFRGDTPFMMTFHGTRAKLTPQMDPRSIVVLYAEKIAAQRCDVAVACSKAVKEELVSLYGTDPGKTVVIHNGVGITKFSPQDKTLARQKLGLPTNRNYALWIGRDPLRKGLLTAEKAIRGLPNTSLLVVGLSGESDGQMVFLGNVSEDCMANAYNAADFLIFPTVYEGFPVAPLEALACGLPVIVSKESNLDEIITEGVHGFVVKDADPKVYREKARFMLADAAARKKMSLECRELAMRYSWKRQAEKYWVAYHRMLGR